MAIYYVWSGAAGGGNGTTWALAYQKLTTAITGKSAGDIFYVAHDHNELTAGNLLITSVGTFAAPMQVTCVNRSGSVPPVEADRRSTALIRVSGNFALSIGGTSFASSIFEGLIFNHGEGSAGNSGLTLAGAANSHVRLNDCQLKNAATGTTAKILASGSAALVELNNTSLSFATTANFFEVSTILKWRNSTALVGGSAVPTSFMRSVANTGSDIEIIGVDFSALGSGSTLITHTNAHATRWKMLDCKLNASVTKYAAITTAGGTEVEILRSSSSAENYVYNLVKGSGDLSNDIVIFRTGGAKDGETPISWKIVTTANCNHSLVFECPPIVVWNDVVGSPVTATVEGIWGSGSLPNNDEIFVDVQYLGSSSSMQASFASDGRASIMASSAAQASSSEEWSGSTTPFKLDVTFTPQQTGWVYARVRCAKPSTTFYIDPTVTLS